MQTLRRKETKIDLSKLLSEKKRNIEWCEADVSSVKSICENRPSSSKYMYTWKHSEEHPSYIKALIRIAKASFSISDTETKGVDVTVFTPPEKNMSGQQTHVPQASIATACRVFICAGTKEFIDISVVNPKKEGDILATETVMISKDQMILLPFGSASATSLSFDNSTSVKTKLRANFRETKVSKQPSNRYIFVLDFIMDPSCIVDMITKFTKTQRFSSEQTQSLISQVEAAISSL